MAGNMWDIKPDLEKLASGESGACGHFVENPAIFDREKKLKMKS